MSYIQLQWPFQNIYLFISLVYLLPAYDPTNNSGYHDLWRYLMLWTVDSCIGISTFG